MPAEGGPPRCVVDDFPYRTESRRLAPGDLLCLTTDGVTEAMTASGELMGRRAVALELAALREGLDARGVTLALQDAVGRFVAGAEPSDDLAILTIRWNGPAKAALKGQISNEISSGNDDFRTGERADRAESSRP